MQLTVKNLQHVSHVFDDVNPDDTVEKFAQQVKEVFKYPDGVRLIYCGRILEKDKLMCDYFKEVNNGFVVAMPEKSKPAHAPASASTPTSTPASTPTSTPTFTTASAPISTNTNINNTNNTNLPTVTPTNTTQTYTLDQIRAMIFVFTRVIKATPDIFYTFCTNDSQFQQFLASPIFINGILQPLAATSTAIAQSLQNGVDFTVPISMSALQTGLASAGLTQSTDLTTMTNTAQTTGSMPTTGPLPDDAPLSFDGDNQTTLTPDDHQNIQELCGLGFDVALVTQVYIMSGKNKEVTASMLFEFSG
jgi:hypothetical protein